MKTQSTAVKLFLSLGLAASVAACGGAPEGGEGGEASDTSTEQPAEGGEGGEGGEG